MNPPEFPSKSSARSSGGFLIESDGRRAERATAAQLAARLAAGELAGARVYRIHRIDADGRMELVVFDPARLGREEAMLFFRRDAAACRADYEQLARMSESCPPSFAARIEWADLAAGSARAVVALLYACEHGDDVSRWLCEIRFEGGDDVEGGEAAAAAYRGMDRTIRNSRTIGGPPSAA